MGGRAQTQRKKMIINTGKKSRAEKNQGRSRKSEGHLWTKIETDIETKIGERVMENTGITAGVMIDLVGIRTKKMKRKKRTIRKLMQRRETNPDGNLEKMRSPGMLL